MDVREKLVELIEKSGACFNCFPVAGYEKEEIEKIASHLIAHGVTVQEWIPVTEELPDELPKDGSPWMERVRPSVDVLVRIKGSKELFVARYSHSFKEWCDPFEEHNFTSDVTHWMPLPPAPEDVK